MEALILITAQPGSLENTLEKVHDLELIEETKLITGPFDIMAKVKVDGIKDIKSTITEKIKKMTSVKDITTCIFVQ